MKAIHLKTNTKRRWWNCDEANVDRQLHRAMAKGRVHLTRQNFARTGIKQSTGHRLVRNDSAALQKTLGCTKARSAS